MSRRIPPSTVSVRRIVSQILNIAIASHEESMRLPGPGGLSHSTGKNSRSFPRCSHRGSYRPQALVNTDYRGIKTILQKGGCVRIADLKEGNALHQRGILLRRTAFGAEDWQK